MTSSVICKTTLHLHSLFENLLTNFTAALMWNTTSAPTQDDTISILHKIKHDPPVTIYHHLTRKPSSNDLATSSFILRNVNSSFVSPAAAIITNFAIIAALSLFICVSRSQALMTTSCQYMTTLYSNHSSHCGCITTLHYETTSYFHTYNHIYSMPSLTSSPTADKIIDVYNQVYGFICPEQDSNLWNLLQVTTLAAALSLAMIAITCLIWTVCSISYRSVTNAQQAKPIYHLGYRPSALQQGQPMTVDLITTKATNSSNIHIVTRLAILAIITILSTQRQHVSAHLVPSRELSYDQTSSVDLIDWPGKAVSDKIHYCEEHFYQESEHPTSQETISMIPLRGSSTIFNFHIRLHHLYRRIQDLPRQKGGDYAIEYSTNRLYSATEDQHRDLTSPQHTFLPPLWSIHWSFKNTSCIETSMTSMQLLLCSSTSQSSSHSLHPYQSRLHFLKFEYLMSPAAFPSSAHAPSSSIAWGDATQAGNSGGKRQTMFHQASVSDQQNAYADEREIDIQHPSTFLTTSTSNLVHTCMIINKSLCCDVIMAIIMLAECTRQQFVHTDSTIFPACRNNSSPILFRNACHTDYVEQHKVMLDDRQILLVYHQRCLLLSIPRQGVYAHTVTTSVQQQRFRVRQVQLISFGPTQLGDLALGSGSTNTSDIDVELSDETFDKRYQGQDYLLFRQELHNHSLRSSKHGYHSFSDGNCLSSSANIRHHQEPIYLLPQVDMPNEASVVSLMRHTSSAHPTSAETTEGSYHYHHRPSTIPKISVFKVTNYASWFQRELDNSSCYDGISFDFGQQPTVHQSTSSIKSSWKRLSRFTDNPPFERENIVQQCKPVDYHRSPIPFPSTIYNIPVSSIPVVLHHHKQQIVTAVIAIFLHQQHMFGYCTILRSKPPSRYGAGRFSDSRMGSLLYGAPSIHHGHHPNSVPQTIGTPSSNLLCLFSTSFYLGQCFKATRISLPQQVSSTSAHDAREHHTILCPSTHRSTDFTASTSRGNLESYQPVKHFASSLECLLMEGQHKTPSSIIVLLPAGNDNVLSLYHMHFEFMTNPQQHQRAMFEYPIDQSHHSMSTGISNTFISHTEQDMNEIATTQCFRLQATHKHVPEDPFKHESSHVMSQVFKQVDSSPIGLCHFISPLTSSSSRNLASPNVHWDFQLQFHPSEATLSSNSLLIHLYDPASVSQSQREARGPSQTRHGDLTLMTTASIIQHLNSPSILYLTDPVDETAIDMLLSSESLALMNYHISWPIFTFASILRLPSIDFRGSLCNHVEDSQITSAQHVFTWTSSYGSAAMRIIIASTFLFHLFFYPRLLKRGSVRISRLHCPGYYLSFSNHWYEMILQCI